MPTGMPPPGGTQPPAGTKPPAAPKTPDSNASANGITKIYTLPNEHVNAFDVVAAFSGKVSGVVALVALGPRDLLYTIDPTKATGLPASPKTKKGSRRSAKASVDLIDQELKSLIDRFPAVTVEREVLALPDGSVGACNIITMIGHQIEGVASLAPVSDTRILAGFTGPHSDDAKTRLRELVSKLAISTVPPFPSVQSTTMRLYYDRDAASVATVVGAAFSQLKVAPVSMNPANTYKDEIVLADPTGSGSRETLSQARRMIALLDQPRAQLTVNAWSLQFSSDKPDNMNELVPQARRLASGYNDALEAAIMRGWSFLNQKDPVPQGFPVSPIEWDREFSGYLCNGSIYGGEGVGFVIQPVKLPSCPARGRLDYGLGYGTLFGGESPDLVQMLILAMATTHPNKVIEETLNRMEGVGDRFRGGAASTRSTAPAGGYDAPQPYESCQETDRQFYEKQVLDFAPPSPSSSEKGSGNFYRNAVSQNAPPYVAFACTRAKLYSLTMPSPAGVAFSTSAIGQFRAAVADFLFHNKMMAEYPNNFQAFLYPASAAKLDNALTPMVEAFNEDLEALQQHLQHQLTANVSQDKHLSYTSNGLISVKIVSGNQAVAQTQSLNYFPQNPTLKLEDFAKALAATQTGSTPPALLAGTLSSIVPAIGAFSAAQPAQVTAKIGSGLSLTVTPFSLSSASGAELNVNVTYNENAAATISGTTTQTGNTGSDDLNSRVSAHNVTTLVRMDSLKFFEISTMQSVIARQRARYKLIDPVIELPLLDGLAIGVRRKPQVIYNQSIIFMEAAIMPTAADLGQGLVMQYDRIVNCPTDSRKKGFTEAHSAAEYCEQSSVGLDEIGGIMEYHKKVINYFLGEYVGSDGIVLPPVGQPSPPRMDAADLPALDARP
jgi:hypothetical protein